MTRDARVLGLDPGTRHFGWGVVERHGRRLLHIAHGIVHTDERTSIASRLVVIERSLVSEQLVRPDLSLSASTAWTRND